MANATIPPAGAANLRTIPFFVRHAYFLGANDPYSALKATLKAEIDREPGKRSMSSACSFDRPRNWIVPALP